MNVKHLKFSPGRRPIIAFNQTHTFSYEEGQKFNINANIVTEQGVRQEEIQNLFGMAIPTSVSVNLAPETIAKIFETAAIMQLSRLEHVEFMDSVRGDTYQNPFTFYLNGQELPIEYYHDVGEYDFPVCEPRFMIIIERFNQATKEKEKKENQYTVTFHLEFMFVAQNAMEFVFYTDDIVISL